MTEDRRLKSGTEKTEAVKNTGVEMTEHARTQSQDAFNLSDGLLWQPLPTLPNIPGFHTCWLSSTSEYDPIHNREAFGYTPVTPEDVKGLQFTTETSGPHEGKITVNEMVAYKIPIDLWERYMRTVHHDNPLNDEREIRDSTRAVAQQIVEAGGRVDQAKGMADLGSVRGANRPTFTG